MNAAVRFLRRRWYVVVAAACLVAGLAWFVKSTLNDAADRKDARERSAAQLASTQQTVENTNRALQILLSVTGPDAQARQAAGTVDILKRNAVELDCRSRRQQARLAAPPDPTRPCVDQTPADVYPGIDGLPTKGAP